jgi:hypothetical protein
MKLVQLIEMFLKKIYSKIRLGKNQCDAVPVQNDLKQEDVYQHCFLLFFRICHEEGPRKSGRTKTECNTSAPGLC